MSEVVNNVVVITGASSGIGQATAKLFSKEGWKVIGIPRRQYENREIDLQIQADISKPEQIKEIFVKIKTFTNHIDALINNSAIQVCKPFTEMDVKEWDLIFHTNVRSVFLCSKYAFPLLKKRQGSIVNVGSVHAIATSDSIAAYAASKGAILALTRALAIECGKDNIRVNAVSPGAVDTPMLHSGLERGHISNSTLEDKLIGLSKRHIVGRIGRPDEIAQAILFLSDHNRSSFITGQSIIVDGGALAKLSTE